MGLVMSNILARLYGKRQVRICMVGLDASGKTTILYQLKMGEVVISIPTVGFNVETVDYKNITFTVYDVGGQTILRPLWRHYYTNAKGLIFVIDSTDTERLNEAQDEFDSMLSNDELRDAAILVLANKQDLPNAMTPAQIGERLGLYKLRGRQWHVQGTCATQAEGIVEGLDWLSRNISNQ